MIFGGNADYCAHVHDSDDVVRITFVGVVDVEFFDFVFIRLEKNFGGCLECSNSHQELIVDGVMERAERRSWREDKVVLFELFCVSIVFFDIRVAHREDETRMTTQKDDFFKKRQWMYRCCCDGFCRRFWNEKELLKTLLDCSIAHVTEHERFQIRSDSRAHKRAKQTRRARKYRSIIEDRKVRQRECTCANIKRDARRERSSRRREAEKKQDELAAIRFVPCARRCNLLVHVLSAELHVERSKTDGIIQISLIGFADVIEQVAFLRHVTIVCDGEAWNGGEEFGDHGHIEVPDAVLCRGEDFVVDDFCGEQVGADGAGEERMGAGKDTSSETEVVVEVVGWLRCLG